MSNIEVYFTIKCPECNVRNWIYDGDTDDSTYFRGEGVRCWQCKHCWIVDEDNILDMDDDPYYEDGRQFIELPTGEK